MKKIVFYIFILVFAATGCESFLDTESYTKKNSSNFPLNEDDAEQLLTGVYTTLSRAQASPGNTYFFTAELASDDRYGGGGENDKDFQVVTHLLYANLDRYKSFWSAKYTGIARANMAISNLATIENEEIRNQKMGEALFLRAYTYFELVQLFGDIPFIERAPEDVDEARTPPAQTPAKDIYAYIAADLKQAYETMPAYPWNQLQSGTVTKWAAAGLLARVYLFYTGFYQETSLPSAEGEAITKDYVIAALNDCTANSGHGLIDDFRSLWPYTNSESKKDYDYAKDAPTWVRDGENKEHVFAIKNSHLADWGTTIGFSNQYCLYFGIRNGGKIDYHNTFPFGQGWGAGPVAPNLWNEWKEDEPDDPRRIASIYDVTSESTDYPYGEDAQMEETGFWQKKIMATASYKANGVDLYNSFTSSTAYYGDGETDNFQLGHEVDLIVIRYADILLMHSELTETTAGINAIRARAGLPAIASYSLAALQKERRYELAFEGLRWGDIRRWHIAEQVLPRKYGQPIWNRGVATVMKPQQGGLAARYQATQGFMPIPQSEIDLADGTLKQNPGWDIPPFVSWME
ncbi:MAG: RagB/SusD family nutrient uptake outer membrane protein [Tannerellaceae bacterium]|jgi:hypothetical protein|nr:RagB/SusD family nutrient uptake outer membrane protein [Tannerellaceae bacterium]